MSVKTFACLLCGTAVLAIAALPAQAQTAPAPATETQAARDGGDIVVTARRTSEKLSQVPASITAFNADAIAKADIQRVTDFTKLTPGVTIVSSTAEAGDNQINIRGLNGARDAESSVALVFDGILKTNSAVLNQDQGTLRQIEVLKGPQGALYGRNAAAGAIVMQTVKPGDHFEGGFTGSYGSQKTGAFNAYLAGPITEGIGFVVSGNYDRTDGFFRNDYLKKLHGRQSRGMGGQRPDPRGARC